jgi:glyoxylase-like metal-dependent hydrolase (beta-lactamase superfamily II)
VSATRLPGLHAIRLPTPFSVGDVNVYLLERIRSFELLTLVDTGPLCEETQRALQAALAELGYAIPDLEQILISHAHPDHYGLAAHLVSQSGARLGAHPHSRPGLESTTTGATASEFYQHWFDQCGVPPSLQSLIGLDHADGYNYASSVAVDYELCDGDELSLAGHQWLVLSTPGHAGGLVCLYQPESGILLASDHLIADITSNPIIEPPPPGQSERPRRLLQYLDQLQRVAALNPSVAYSGHGLPVTDVAALVTHRIAFHQRRADRIFRLLALHPQTVFQLVRQLFPPDLPPVHFFLALSEVQGHLDLLVHQSRAVCITSPSACLWQPV